MAILNFLPEFKVVEINRSTGLVAGHVLAQFPLDGEFDGIVTHGGADYLENGFVLGLGVDGVLAAFDPEVHAQPVLAFTEEITTIFDGLKWFAVEEDDEGVIYPRGLGLFVGDAFTTDNYAAAGVALADAVAAKVVDGVLTLQDQADADSVFLAAQSTLPTGDDAVQFTYVGLSQRVAA